jgi:hypothetical protein
MERIAGNRGIEQLGEEFSEPAHGPDVVLVAERGEETFLEGLIPADLTGAGGEFLAFPFESDLGGLGEQLAEGGIRPIVECGLATAPQGFWQDGVDTEPMA